MRFVVERCRSSIVTKRASKLEIRFEVLKAKWSASTNAVNDESDFTQVHEFCVTRMIRKSHSEILYYFSATTGIQQV
jgi:hypothetical protein